MHEKSYKNITEENRIKNAIKLLTDIPKCGKIIETWNGYHKN